MLRAHRISLSEAAIAWKVPLTTLSGLGQGDNGASMVTVRKIEGAVGEEDAKAIFPQLAGFREPATSETDFGAVA